MSTSLSLDLTKKYRKIELFGLPGSGKSYLSTTFAKEYGRARILIQGRLQRYAFALIFFVVHPILFCVYLRLIFRQYHLSKHPGLKHKIFFLFLKACATECKALFYRECFIDEGLYQFIFSLHETSMTENDLIFNLKLLRRLKRGLCFVSAGSEIRSRRLRARGRHFRGSFDKHYLEVFSKVCEYNNKVIAQNISKFAPETEIIYNNHDT